MKVGFQMHIGCTQAEVIDGVLDLPSCHTKSGFTVCHFPSTELKRFQGGQYRALFGIFHTKKHIAAFALAFDKRL